MGAESQHANRTNALICWDSAVTQTALLHLYRHCKWCSCIYRDHKCLKNVKICPKMWASILVIIFIKSPFHTAILVNYHKITWTTFPVNTQMCRSHMQRRSLFNGKISTDFVAAHTTDTVLCSHTASYQWFTGNVTTYHAGKCSQNWLPVFLKRSCSRMLS